MPAARGHVDGRATNPYQLAEIIDQAYVSCPPAIISTRSGEEIVLLQRDLLQEILKSHSLKPEVLPEDNGSITIALDELEIYINNATKESAPNDLINDLKIYAEDYCNQFELYFNSVNRRQHILYILRILLYTTSDEIKALLDI